MPDGPEERDDSMTHQPIWNRSSATRPGQALALAWSGLFVLLAEPAAAQTHPRLLFGAGDVPGLQARAAAARARILGGATDSFYANPYNEILIDCRSTYGPSRPIPNSNRSRNAQAIMSHGALLLLDPSGLAQDPSYQSNTRFFGYFNATLNLSGWSNFFGNNPIDAGYLLVGLAVGFDMHYEKFTTAEKADIISKLAARADYIVNTLPETTSSMPSAADLDPATNPNFFHNETFKILRNRFLIPLAGLGMVAFALEGEGGVSTSRFNSWINKLEQGLTLWKTYVSPSGHSHESYHYHEFAMQVLFPMFEARRRRTGVNAFQEIPYLTHHPIYSLYNWVPGGDRSFGLSGPDGDSATGPAAEVISNMAYAAARLKGHPQGWDRLANWAQFRAFIPGTGGDPNPNLSYFRDDPLHFFWADETIAMSSPSELGLPTWHYFPTWGLFVWRTSWAEDATYFGLICGRQVGGHMQPEMGNFWIYRAGAPYLAHHMHTLNRDTRHHNVMIVGSQGQWGEESTTPPRGTTTKPQPPERWPTIERALGHNQFFNVLANLRPVYMETALTSYRREYLGFVHSFDEPASSGQYFFVLDRATASPSRRFDHIVHAYKTLPPFEDAGPGTVAGRFDTVLWIDSDRLANPFTGSGEQFTIRPRNTGSLPISLGMVVKDVSPSAWSGAVADSLVSDISGGDNWRRGSKLTRTFNGTNAEALNVYYFPRSGDVISRWTGSSDIGFILTNGGTVALTVWPRTGVVNNVNGLTVNGQMGGVHVTNNWFWGRDVTSLAFGGQTLLNASAPVTIYADTQKPSGNSLSLLSSAAADVSLFHPQSVTDVRLNGQTLSAANWSWSAGFLHLVSLPAQTAAALIETTVGAPPAYAFTQVRDTIDLRVAGNVSGWTPQNFGDPTGQVTTGASGLCLNVSAVGNNFVEWNSPRSFIDLVKNAVYRARFTVTTSQTAVDAIPIWFLNWFNADPGGFGIIYGGERFFVDVAGGAASPGRNGNSIYDLYFAPLATGAQQWNGELPGGNPDNALSPFDPSAAGLDALGFQFRVIDVDSVNAFPDGSADPIGSRFDSGQLCITSLRVDRIDLSLVKAHVVETAFNPAGTLNASMAELLRPLTGQVSTSEIQPTGVVNLQLGNTPGPRSTPGLGEIEFIRLQPRVEGLADTILSGALRNPAKFHPIVHLPDALYLGRFRIANAVAGTATAGTIDPVDVIIVNWDNPSFEVGGKDFITRAAVGRPLDRAASPRAPVNTGGVTQEYVAFFFGHAPSIGDVDQDGVGDPSLFPGADSLRSTIDFFNADFIGTSVMGPDGIPGVGPSGADAFTVESFRVDRVELPQG